LNLLAKYYSILGLAENASIKAIKKAYRSKAKQVHPDRNPSPNAEAEFIELNEAYQYVSTLKKGGYKTKKNTQVQDFEKWWYAEETKRKAKARQQAQMRYEEYINSDDFMMNNALEVISHYFLVLFVLALSITLFILFFSIGNLFTGIVLSSIIFAIVSPLLYHLSKSFLTHKYSLLSLLSSLKTIVTSSWFLIALALIFNIYIFTTITIQTFIGSKGIILLFVAVPMFIYAVISILLKKHKYYIHKRTISTVLVPLFFNSIFIINYLGASQPRQETYSYEIDFAKSTINFEHDKYKKYWGIRFFFFTEEVKTHNKIIYTIEEGALGLRVVSDYKLFLDLSYL